MPSRTPAATSVKLSAAPIAAVTWNLSHEPTVTAAGLNV